jgi:tRNA pseudouridine38-40 synthase
MKCKLTIAYEGTAYEGWRSQRPERGVQHVIEQNWQKIFHADPQIISSSRTDSGVHAMGLVAHAVISNKKIPLQKIPAIMNAELPATVRIIAATKVSDSFHARFDAVSKEYRYQVWNHPVMNPLLRLHSWHVPKLLDFDAMKSAAKLFEGTHDYRAFTAKRNGILADTQRTLTRCDIKRSGSQLTFRIESNGFLYKMCRAIVGSIIRVGSGAGSEQEIYDAFDTENPRQSRMIAPAHGLTLWKVRY